MLGEGETVEHETRTADEILSQLPPGESTLVAQVDGNIGVIRAVSRPAVKPRWHLIA